MRVVCIDNEPYSTSRYPENVKELKVGEEYTVIAHPHPMGYFLAELPCKSSLGFWDKRFIPISSIDETQMERNYDKIKQTV